MIAIYLRRPQDSGKIPEGDSLRLSGEIEECLYRPTCVRTPPPANQFQDDAELGVRQYAGGTL